MDIPDRRQWMYNRVTPCRRDFTEPFMRGVDEFLEHACQLQLYTTEGKIRCPCAKCKCKRLDIFDVVKTHIYKHGFLPNYYYWTSHGERLPPRTVPTVNPLSNDQPMFNVEDHGQYNQYEAMVRDVAGPSFQAGVEEPPNANAQPFFDMLIKSTRTPLYEGCSSSELEAAVRSLSLKADYNMSEQCYNDMMQWVGEMLPEGHRLTQDFYRTKKMISKLGLSYEKIDCCVNGCMLYYKDDSNLTQCKFCGCARYTYKKSHCGRGRKIANKQLWFLPLIPRLQRLFTSTMTAKEMRWHHENHRETGVLSHPSDGEAWKVFDQTHPDFAKDPRNVRLGLCTDGFTPYGLSSRNYSCWPVIVTPYNLPPWMCMKQEYMFLSLIIPGPSNPKAKIDVYLQPLIDELKILWEEGISTYDISLKQNFQMRAALLWTISDFPAYGMLSGWMTAGKLACPICMERSKAFTLKHGRKTSFFDCHRQFLSMTHQYRRNKTSFLKNKVEESEPPQRLDGDEVWERVCNLPKVTENGHAQPISSYGVTHHWTKQSIFWELPYWKTNLLRHNLDVMHIEKNVFDNVFYTVMDTKGKTKDNAKSRMDIKELCRRKELELVEKGRKLLKPKAQYTFNVDQKRAICRWIQNLKLPDGYASNLARSVKPDECKFKGLKSHDCHIFMERLLPIAFSALPQVVWTPLVELSQFFTSLCSTTLKVDQLTLMEENIVVTLCKLEKIFPPGFFDSMEHLPIHLPYEAKVGGPVQYRWMYPFERFLHTLKRKVKNKARVEGSICEAYIIEETATFCSYYFDEHVRCRRTRVPRNDDGGESIHHPPLSIFNYPGRPSGQRRSCFLTDCELEAITMYVLKNCDEVQPYLDLYEKAIRRSTPRISGDEVAKRIDTEFPTWFREYVQNPHNEVCDPFIKDMAWGPKRVVHTWPIYFVNGYKFHTESWSEHKATNNSGVCIKGTHYNKSESDYYGVLEEIVEVEYPGLPVKYLVLFKCRWYDPRLKHGVTIDKQFGFVEIRESSRYQRYEPFIFSQQAMQVYFAPYPVAQNAKADWRAVIRTKARSVIDAPSIEVNDNAFQGDEVQNIIPVNTNNDELPTLRDSRNIYEEVGGVFINNDMNGYEVNDNEVSDSSDDDGDSDDEHESSYDFSD